MQDEASYRCAYCGQRNSVTVDPSAGSHQEYVEDCQVCCRPNMLRITVDDSRDRFVVTAHCENE